MISCHTSITYTYIMYMFSWKLQQATNWQDLPKAVWSFHIQIHHHYHWLLITYSGRAGFTWSACIRRQCSLSLWCMHIDLYICWLVFMRLFTDLEPFAKTKWSFKTNKENELDLLYPLVTGLCREWHDQVNGLLEYILYPMRKAGLVQLQKLF